MAHRFEPLNDQLLVEMATPEEKSKGGIVIPDGAKEKPTQGTVRAVGPGAWQNGILIKTTVKEGDTILLSSYAGTEVKIDGVPYQVAHERDILGILRPPAHAIGVDNSDKDESKLVSGTGEEKPVSVSDANDNVAFLRDGKGLGSGRAYEDIPPEQTPETPK